MDNEVIPQVNISSEHGLRKIDFIDNDFAIFNDAWDIPMDEYPNRINAAVIAVCLAGEGTVCINLQEYKLTAGNTYLDPKGSQIGKKESIADTARVLAGMYDGISLFFMEKSKDER